MMQSLVPVVLVLELTYTLYKVRMNKEGVSVSYVQYRTNCQNREHEYTRVVFSLTTMRLFRSTDHHKVGSTARIEGYTDAFLAIIITLLVLELHVPELEDSSLMGVLHGIQSICPELLAFAFSFLTLSVFWVNHHHFSMK